MSPATPILITGASGFVGTNLLLRLIKEVPPCDIHILLRKESNTWRIRDVIKQVSVHIVDLRSKVATEALVRKVKPRTILHLATHGAYPYQADDEVKIFETNMLCTFNLVQSVLKNGFDSLINIGTSAEYGVNKKPMSEHDPLKPMTAYGASKAWSTLYGQYLALTRDAPITTLRFFGVYGYYEPRGRLIPNIILSLLLGEPLNLVEPRFARDFIFVDDVVSACMLAAKRCPVGGIFNIGSGKAVTIREVFTTIQHIIKSDIRVQWPEHTSQSADTNRRVADISLVKKKLGWTPKTNLYSGLQKTVQWFKVNIDLYEDSSIKKRR